MVEPELKQAEYANSAPSGVVEPDSPSINLDQAGTLAPVDTSNEQWREIGEKAYSFLSALPEYLGKFFSEYRKPLVTLGLILGSIVSVKLTLALLGAVNDIPLLEPTFELIGVGYTIWFVYRYLLRASNRQELSQEFDKLKSQVVGK
jgi:CAAD domains of cyanobacterial aminoacyl-tRNA synthetase